MKAPELELRTDWHYGEERGCRFYVVEAWTDGTFAGRAHGWFEPGRQFILEKIEVEPAHRSRGYGRAMIAELRRKARSEACRELVIRGVMASNHDAIRLYVALGAQLVHSRDTLLDYSFAPP